MRAQALFEKNNVNPLAGCLPSLAQIPVFLGVYYSVTSIAKAKIFSEGFLWIPNLSGPIADRTEGLSWLTEGWCGAPARPRARAHAPAPRACPRATCMPPRHAHGRPTGSCVTRCAAAVVVWVGWGGKGHTPCGGGTYT